MVARTRTSPGLLCLGWVCGGGGGGEREKGAATATDRTWGHRTMIPHFGNMKALETLIHMKRPICRIVVVGWVGGCGGGVCLSDSPLGETLLKNRHWCLDSCLRSSFCPSDAVSFKGVSFFDNALFLISDTHGFGADEEGPAKFSDQPHKPSVRQFLYIWFCGHSKQIWRFEVWVFYLSENELQIRMLLQQTINMLITTPSGQVWALFLTQLCGKLKEGGQQARLDGQVNNPVLTAPPSSAIAQLQRPVTNFLQLV